MGIVKYTADRKFTIGQALNDGWKQEWEGEEAIVGLKLHDRKKAKHKVFKGRFDSKEMVNSDLYREKLNYIHNNPCTPRWSLAERPEDYRHSSASNYIKGYGIYDVDLIY